MIRELKYEHPFYNGQSEHGRSTMFVICPFCNEELEVYIWSFYGCGRICECGAKLNRIKAQRVIQEPINKERAN